MKEDFNLFKEPETLVITKIFFNQRRKKKNQLKGLFDNYQRLLKISY